MAFSRDHHAASINPSAQPNLKAQGMITLSAQRLLLRHSDGHIQIGNPAVGWDDIIQLPMTYLVAVAREGQGALVGGSLHPPVGEEIGVVAAIDERGAVLQQWTWNPGIVSSVATRPGERWAVAGDAIRRLLPDGATQKRTDGALGALVALPPTGPEIVCTPAAVLADTGRVVLFDLADIAHNPGFR